MADKVDVRYHLRCHGLRPAVLLVVGHFSGLSKSLRSPSSDLCHVRCPIVKSMSRLNWVEMGDSSLFDLTFNNDHT